MVLGCVLAASAHDVGSNRTLVEVWQGTDDLVGFERPILRAAEPLSRSKHLGVDWLAVLSVAVLPDHT